MCTLGAFLVSSWGMNILFIVEDPRATSRCRTGIKALFLDNLDIFHVYCVSCCHTHSHSISFLSLCFNEQSGSIYKRNKYFTRKKRYRKNLSTFKSNRFLQYLISCSQEKRQDENGHEFKTIERASEESSFQNGHNGKSHKPRETKRLGNISRPVRRIPARTNISESQKVHEVLCPEPMLSMESNVLRGNFCSSSFYKNSFGSSCISKSSKHPTSSIFGRLANSQSKQKSFTSGSSEMPRSFGFTGFHCEQREIQSNPISENNISGGNVSFGSGISISNSGESSETSVVDSRFSTGSKYSSKFSKNSGHNSILHRVDSKCPSLHETYSVAPVKFLESNVERHDSNYSMYTTSKISSFVVDRFSQHAERPIFSTSENHNYGHNRCFEKRFWGLHWHSDFSGGMESRSKELAYKLSGDESSLFDTATFHTSSEEQMCFDTKRQHKHSSVHKPTRGNSVSKSVLFDMATLATCPAEQCDVEGRTYNGENEYSGRSFESSQDPSNRMDTKQGSSGANFSEMGGSFSGPVCFESEQTNSSFLYLVPSSECTSDGCSFNIMGEHLCLCLSSDLSHTEGPKLYEAVQVSNNTNSTAVAQEVLVSTNSRIVDSTSSQVASIRESIEATQDSDLPSKSRNVKSECMASINRNFETEGFSKSARDLLVASWRSGTQRDYAAKFEKFSGWCASKQIDPYSATLNQVADFLAYLFESGLQYRTIGGYRSMLSAVLPPVQNCPIGKHPHICRLIKGVFHSRPPKVKLLPEWDLETVLNALEKDPFEPQDKASLKFLTLKTVFLTAITTFRRCSDLQSLRIDQDSMKIQGKGITFIRHGLSKQDRQNHFGVKIHVAHNSEKELLDPKRSILHYLDRTKSYREKLSATDKVKLFIALNEPHKPVSTTTISSWIVQAIKKAYSDDNLKVNAHSTRAIAPTWALYKGASTKTILEAADWSSESTFVKFYLRDLGSQSVLQ